MIFARLSSSIKLSKERHKKPTKKFDIAKLDYDIKKLSCILSNLSWTKLATQFLLWFISSRNCQVRSFVSENNTIKSSDTDMANLRFFLVLKADLLW